MESDAKFDIELENGIEAAAFLPLQDATINDTAFNAGDFVAFNDEAGGIELHNLSKAPIEIILFGGARYTEPIVSQGPFVMNDRDGIATAYADYSAGRYGTIEYPAS